MFEFEKLNVFEKAVDLSAEVSKFVDAHEFAETASKQMTDAANQTVVELARASAQIVFEEKQKHFTDARARIHELAAILILINQEEGLPEEEFKKFYDRLTQLSIMLYKLVQNSKPFKAEEETNSVPEPVEAG